MKNWIKANFLSCKKIPIDLWLSLSEKGFTQLCLFRIHEQAVITNTLLMRAHFHYSLWDHWRIKNHFFVLKNWNIQLNLGNFTGFQSSSWLVRAEGVPSIEDFLFPLLVLSVSLIFLAWKTMEKKVRLKDCKAIKNFMCHFDGVCGQVSPIDWPLMKSMKGFACVWHWNPTRVL